MSLDYEKSSADIEREIEHDRERIGEKLSAIQEKLTPGQLIDEALGYLKSSGGAEYIGNLGGAVKANPVPLALMGVSIAWLMAGSGQTAPRSPAYRADSAPLDYPLATVSGNVRRTGPPRMENGRHYADFQDMAGKRFKAQTDETGRRAGDYMDEAGSLFRGFADATGRRITDIRDETGALFDEALGWAADTWASARDTAGGMMDSVTKSLSGMGSSIGSTSSSAMSGVQDQAGRLNDMILKTFRDQPLVGGALAFAAGAAIGAALPHTAREDQLMGEAADQVKDDLGEKSAALMDQGKKVAGEVYEKAVGMADELHDQARDRIIEESRTFRDQSGNTAVRGTGASL